MRILLSCLALAASLVPAAAGDWERYDQPAYSRAEGIGIGELAESCRRDADRLCYGVPPGRMRIAECLADQRREVSPGCRLALDVAEVARSCKEDYHRFCPGVPVGRGDVVNCLENYERDLTSHCRAALAQRDDAVVEQGDGGYHRDTARAYTYKREHDRYDDAPAERYVEKRYERDDTHAPRYEERREEYDGPPLLK